MGLLDSLIYGLRDVFDGSDNQLPRRSRIKFTGDVTDDLDNDMLVVTTGTGGGVDGPGARVWNTGADPISLPHFTNVSVPFDIDTGAQRFNSGAVWDDGAPYSLVATSAGRYLVIGSAILTVPDPTGRRILFIQRLPSDQSSQMCIARTEIGANGVNTDYALEVSCIVNLLAGDIVRLIAVQLNDSTVSGEVVSVATLSEYSPSFMMQRIGT